MKNAICVAVAALCVSTIAAHAQVSDDAIRLLVLNDQSGLTSDNNGMGSVEAVRMAVEDYGGVAAGKKVEVFFADHQGKPDIGSALARDWIDTKGADAIIDVPFSSVALAISGIVRERNKALLLSAAGATTLTREQCSPNTVNWTFDSHMLAHTVAKASVQSGLKKWFFLTSDYAFGHQMEADAGEVVKAGGGEVLGAVRHPAFTTSDFSSFLLQAQSSGADVIGLANAGPDTINSIKQAHEFGIGGGTQKLAAMLLYVSDVKALGLDVTQGIQVASPFYWDLNEGTRAWAKRFAERRDGNYPTMNQAGAYAVTLHYLKAIDAAGTDAGNGAVRKMKELPTDDPLFGKGHIRGDGRKIHDVYLFEVKAPDASTGPYDYYRYVATVKGEDAFQSMLPECDFLK